MRVRRSRTGSRTTTKIVRTAACSTVRQWSSPRSQQRASTKMEWGKRPQTPASCPTPPSPLRRKERGANKNRRKSHYPWTKNGGQVNGPDHSYRGMCRPTRFASLKRMVGGEDLNLRMGLLGNQNRGGSGVRESRCGAISITCRSLEGAASARSYPQVRL